MQGSKSNIITLHYILNDAVSRAFLLSEFAITWQRRPTLRTHMLTEVVAPRYSRSIIGGNAVDLEMQLSRMRLGTINYVSVLSFSMFSHAYHAKKNDNSEHCDC